MAPSTRIILALLGVTASALALCAALVFGGLDRLGLRAAEANIDFLLTELRSSIEANLSLGLALPDVRVAQSLAEQAKAADDRVLAVEVFSPAGISIFNTDRGAVGEAIPEAWRRAVSYRADGDLWRVEERGAITVGQVMRNDFGEPVGHVAVTISDAARASHAAGLLAALAGQAALLAPAALLAVLIVAYLALTRATRDVARLAEGLETGAPDADGTGETGLPGGRALEDAAFAGAAARVRASAARAARDFEQAAEDVMKADEA